MRSVRTESIIRQLDLYSTLLWQGIAYCRSDISWEITERLHCDSLRHYVLSAE